ncbi:MAG: metal ABC transporter ATP-binding protein [Saprospiraceae bacterium]
MNTPIIEIKGLNVSYDKKNVLTNIYLQIEEANTYGVVGPNGAGKSTLFKAILGLVQYHQGDITVYGQPVENVRKRMAYIPQKDNFDWDFPATVLDIVLMGRYPHKKLFQKLNNEDHHKAFEAMKAMQIDDLSNRQIGRLSGGQQQRVFIARAICQEADIFFLDEPFAGVDVTTEEKIVQLMHQLKQEGKTFILVHHDLTTVEKYFDKIILINQRLIAYGNTKEIFTQENLSHCYGSQLSILHKIQQL